MASRTVSAHQAASKVTRKALPTHTSSLVTGATNSVTNTEVISSRHKEHTSRVHTVIISGLLPTTTSKLLMEATGQAVLKDIRR